MLGVYPRLIDDFDTSTFSTRIQNVTLDEVKEAVGKELEGPGKLLGYRALHQKIRQEHLLNAPRDLPYFLCGNAGNGS